MKNDYVNLVFISYLSKLIPIDIKASNEKIMGQMYIYNYHADNCKCVRPLILIILYEAIYSL